MKILLISSVLPRNTSGGEVILYRHFSQVPGLNLAIATDSDAKDLPADEIIPIQENQILVRFTRTRFGKLAHGIRQFANSFSAAPIKQYIKHQKPDLIVTVAHGELCWLAQQIAQTFNITLVTFFHDWWPDLAYVYSWMRGSLTWKFKQLYQSSQLAFCVSEEMKSALGIHSNAQVLFPIPENSIPEKFTLKQSISLSKQKNRFVIVYSGSLAGIYGPMMQALSLLLQHKSDVQLKLFGPRPDWPDCMVEEMCDRGIYGGFIARDLLEHELGYADALLVAMSFDERDRKRMKTSFPSKLVDYCQFGKPIIIWGPDYCSAVSWGNREQIALVVTSPLVEGLAEAIGTLKTQPEKQQHLGNRALEMAKKMFDSTKIQHQFTQNLYQISSANFDYNPH